jgi:hypothetical protein
LIGRPVHLKKVTFAQFEGEHMPMLWDIFCFSLLLPRGFSRSQYSNEQSSFVQCKIYFDRVLIRKKLFLENCQSYFKSDECSWDIIPGANLCPKVTF